MKTTQEIIDYMKQNNYCLNQSKMKLGIDMYNLGYKEAKEEECD